MRTFVDTNVLVYAHDGHEPTKQAVAQQRVAELWSSRDGVLSTQVLAEFVVTVTGKWRDRVDVVDARNVVATFEEWAPHRISAADVVEAIDIGTRSSLSFWDSLIMVAAIRTRAEVLLTEDLAHGQVIEGLRIENPFV